MASVTSSLSASSINRRSRSETGYVNLNRSAKFGGFQITRQTQAEIGGNESVFYSFEYLHLISRHVISAPLEKPNSKSKATVTVASFSIV